MYEKYKNKKNINNTAVDSYKHTSLPLHFTAPFCSSSNCI